MTYNLELKLVVYEDLGTTVASSLKPYIAARGRDNHRAIEALIAGIQAQLETDIGQGIKPLSYPCSQKAPDEIVERFRNGSPIRKSPYVVKLTMPPRSKDAAELHILEIRQGS